MLGEGAFCAAYRATLPNGRGEACARVLLDGCSRELLKDLAVLADVADLTVPLYGYSLHRGEWSRVPANFWLVPETFTYFSSQGCEAVT